LFNPAEVSDDCRQRDGHDGLVERGQKHAEQQRAQYHEDLPMRQEGLRR